MHCVVLKGGNHEPVQDKRMVILGNNLHQMEFHSLWVIVVIYPIRGFD
jgi:hypothetical protein